MNRHEIDALPLEGDVSFRERTPEPDRTALLLIDLQKGEYNEKKIKAEPQHAYFWDRLAKTVIPNGQKLLKACRRPASKSCSPMSSATHWMDATAAWTTRFRGSSFPRALRMRRSSTN
jgi:hypothetical protein